MSINLQQQTPEWHAARVGKITGSRVAAVLGCSPFASRKKVMREMAEELLGNFSDFDNPAMEYGRENEAKAVKTYEFLYGKPDQPIQETGFWEKGDLGASPDRLVGEDGLLEVKCPYGMRNEVSPHFKSIKDQKHYWHQIQLQLYCTGRKWCDFYQWSEHGEQVERVEVDESWFNRNVDEFVVFIGELSELVKRIAAGGAEERVAMSARWAAAAEAYKLALMTKTAAEKEMSDAKQAMIDLMQASEINHCEGHGILITHSQRKGSVDYKALAMSELDADAVKEIEDKFRRKTTEVWTVKEVGDE